MCDVWAGAPVRAAPRCEDVAVAPQPLPVAHPRPQHPAVAAGLGLDGEEVLGELIPGDAEILVQLLEERVAARDAKGDETSGEVPSLVEGG